MPLKLINGLRGTVITLMLILMRLRDESRVCVRALCGREAGAHLAASGGEGGGEFLAASGDAGQLAADDVRRQTWPHAIRQIPLNSRQ